MNNRNLRLDSLKGFLIILVILGHITDDYNLIYFIYEGEGGIIGTDNGCQTSMENFKAPQRKAFFGKCLVVAKGKGSVTAKSATLKPTWIEID